jgi:Fur family ferric uptake transcriptional regulator
MERSMERNTVQRRAIHRAFEESGRPMGPPEVFDAARGIAPGLGIATVYRTIKRLLDEGWLQQVELPGEAPRYEVAGKEHHHHFRCNNCNKVYDLQGCPNAFKQILPKGFSLEGHELFLFGRCENCAAA